MSREERRAYQRQMKSMERGPAIPPAARARAERKAARREARRSSTAASRPFTPSFLLRAVLIAAALGLVGFSLQWGEGMPRALYVGLAVAAIALAVVLGVRYLMTRATSAS